MIKQVSFGDHPEYGHLTKPITEAMEGIYELGVINLSEGKSLHIIHLSRLDVSKLGKYVGQLEGLTHPSDKFSNSKYDWCQFPSCRPSFTSLHNGKELGQIRITKGNHETGWHYGYRLIDRNSGLAFAYVYGNTQLNSEPYNPKYGQPIEFLRRSILHTGPYFINNPLLTRIDEFTLQTKATKIQTDVKLQFLGLRTSGKGIGKDANINKEQQKITEIPEGLQHRNPSVRRPKETSRNTIHKLKNKVIKPSPRKSIGIRN